MVTVLRRQRLLLASVAYLLLCLTQRLVQCQFSAASPLYQVSTVVTPTGVTPTGVTPTVSEGTISPVPPTNSGCTDFDLQYSNPTFGVIFRPITGESAFYVQGNVEICIGGVFYGICDEGWDDNDAQVACTVLGYSQSEYRGTALRGLTFTSTSIADNVMCFGNETSVSQCNYTAPPANVRCRTSTTAAAGARCTLVRSRCFVEGDITIVNPIYDHYLNLYTGGPVNISGKVGVCPGVNDVYDSVCDIDWDENDATVLCRGLNIRAGIPLYGLNAGYDPVALESVHCDGTEKDISDCPTSPIGQLTSTCRQPNRTAGVVCSVKDGDCVESIVRLVNGSTFYEGRYEVCRNNTWLSVCDVGVDLLHANLACERRAHLGGNAVPVLGSAYGRGTGQQLAVCNRSSSIIEIVPVENCTSNPDLQRLCSHDRDAGVRCQPGLLSMSIISTSIPTEGSTSFALQCSASQVPWETRLHSDSWYKFDDQLLSGESTSIELLESSYNPSVFSFGYTYRSQLTFAEPLTISDGGEYTCNVSVQLTYPDDSTYLLTNTTTYRLYIEVPSPLVSIELNGTQYAGTRLEVNCFVDMPISGLDPYVKIDYFDSSFNNLSSLLESFPREDVQLLPTQRHNSTHFVRMLIVDQLRPEDQGFYFCYGNFSGPYLLSDATSKEVYLRVFANDSGSGVLENFFSFGTAHGDTIVPSQDDGSSSVVRLTTDVVIFGTKYNTLYVSTNGLLSFGVPFTQISSNGQDFDSLFSTPPIIAPFWDDINVFDGGTIYYRQDSDPMIVEQLRRELSMEYPEAELFHPSLMFIATWDRVAPYSFQSIGAVNTFQVTVATDGTLTFVRFSYGAIQWGGLETLIGVSAGDGFNFITHPSSLSSSVLSLDTTTVFYRVDRVNTTVVPTTTPCVEGEIRSNFVQTSFGQLGSFEGPFDICVGGSFGRACDIGWNQVAAQAICQNEYGDGFVAEPLFNLYDPSRNYVAQNVMCHNLFDGTLICTYDTLISSDCFSGSHVAGLRCTQAPPPPLEVQGLCSVVVWYSPNVSCDLIHGYDVRLYQPESSHQNVTRRVGSNQTFYIIKDEDKLGRTTEETYLQVRVVHRGIVSEWTHEVSLGCDKPEKPRVYFELNGKVYRNNSVLSSTNVGEGESALYCWTDKEECCGTKPNRFGKFYYPNGVEVPIKRFQHRFYRDRGEQYIRLNQREGGEALTGMYSCEIPNSDNTMVKIYIRLT